MGAYALGFGTLRLMDRNRIGELVRQRRDALRLSLRNAAARTEGEVAFSTWQQVESGQLNWSADTLASVVLALGAHLEVRLIAGPEQHGDPMRLALLDRLSACVDQLPDDAVRSLLAQIGVYEETLGIQVHSSR